MCPRNATRGTGNKAQSQSPNYRFAVGQVRRKRGGKEKTGVSDVPKTFWRTEVARGKSTTTANDARDPTGQPGVKARFRNLRRVFHSLSTQCAKAGQCRKLLRDSPQDIVGLTLMNGLGLPHEQQFIAPSGRLSGPVAFRNKWDSISSGDVMQRKAISSRRVGRESGTSRRTEHAMSENPATSAAV